MLLRVSEYSEIQGTFKPTRNSGHEPLPDASAPLSHCHPHSPPPFHMSRSWITAWLRELPGICPWFSVGNGNLQKNYSRKVWLGHFHFAIFLWNPVDFIYISMYIYQIFYIHRNVKAVRKRRVNTEFWIPTKSPNCSFLTPCVILKWIKLLYSSTNWETSYWQNMIRLNIFQTSTKN